MDDEVRSRAEILSADRLQGEGRIGPLHGAKFYVLPSDPYNGLAVAEALRFLNEHIAVLEARIERLEVARSASGDLSTP